MSAQRLSKIPGKNRSSLVLTMRKLWEEGRFSEAAAIYDADAGPDPDFEAVLLRARAYLKSDAAPSAIDLLERRRSPKGSSSALHSMVTAQAYAQVGNYTSADQLFDEAAASARGDAELITDISYYRAQRYLFERRTGEARTLLPDVQALAAEFGQLRALHLESFILEIEGRHREEALVLMQLLARMDPSRTSHMEIRAWASNALAGLARELYLPEALPEIERQLTGADWPPDFDDRRFQTLRALGWACALRGDYFNAFRHLRLASKKATSDAWRAIAAAERAELARCKGEAIWSRQELAEAEEYATSVDWNSTRDNARLGLLLLADLFVPLDAAKASYYRSKFAEFENIKAPNFFYRDDPRLKALAQYSSGIVDLALGRKRAGLDALGSALTIFDAHSYEWRAGRCALHLYRETADEAHLTLASERLRHYMYSWLGDQLRDVSQRSQHLTPMQQRIYDMLCNGLSTEQIVKKLGRSESTVRNHIKALLKATGLKSRVALVASATDRQH